MKYKYDDRGIWQFAGGHMFDGRLAGAICETLDRHGVKSIIDIGCGDGAYTMHLDRCGYEISGYDGNPLTPDITKGLCGIADFSVPQDLGLYDCALSLEVGEHIPAEYEDVFIDNLVNHARDWVILSWATPGQTGHGHVNERENGYIIGKMLLRRWHYDEETSHYLRDRVSTCPWFKTTVMAFRYHLEVRDGA